MDSKLKKRAVAISTLGILLLITVVLFINFPRSEKTGRKPTDINDVALDEQGNEQTEVDTNSLRDFLEDEDFFDEETEKLVRGYLGAYDVAANKIHTRFIAAAMACNAETCIVVMRQIFISTAFIFFFKCKLKNFHIRETTFPNQMSYTVCNQTKVFCNNWFISQSVTKSTE